MSFRPAEILLTERLRLRPPTLDDATPIFRAYGQDPEVSRYTVWQPHDGPKITEQFLAEAIEAWRTQPRFVWVVEGKSSGELVGGAEARVDGHRVELGYVVRRSHWGNGYASEVVRGLIDHALADASVWRVWAHCHVDNVASGSVLEKCGMQREGRLCRGFVFPNLSDVPADIYLYAVTK